MAYSRWVNGNQVAYGSGGWYRFVIDSDVSGGYISIRWGVETNVSLYDSTNTAWAGLDASGTTYTNVSYSHSGAKVTWLREGAYTLSRGQSISAQGYVQNLAEGSGGGARSTAAPASYTYPALPPNQMSAPTITNLAGTTHTVNWSAPGTNGSAITGFFLEWQTAAGAAVTTADPLSSDSTFNTTGFAENTEYRVRAYAKSAAGNGTPSAWTNFTTPVAVPIAPGAPTVTRTSDTSHSLAWSRGSQVAGPYASQEVLRRSRAGGVWGAYSVIAPLSGAVTTYVDPTTVANQSYDYQIRATNASGTATSAASGIVWTTPGVPTSQAAAKDAAANIIVTWVAPASAPNAADLKYEVSESTDAGATWTVKTTTAAGTLTYLHSAPSAVLPHIYRVRAIVSPAGLVGSDLASGYVSTNTVQLLTPPAAPTGLTSTPAGTANRAQTIVLSWTYNSLDSSPQTKYTLQHRAVGSGIWTTTVGPISSEVSSYTLPANAYPTGTAFEWQVLTYGLHANPGPYSATATVQISSAPGVSISSPSAGSVVASTVAATSWTFSDADGDSQGAWEATLYEGGVPVETKTGSDTSSSTTFSYYLRELAYTVQVRVRDSRGLWSSPDTKAFTVNYPEPPTPEITDSRWDWETATVELEISVPTPTGAEVAVDHLEVWRSLDDGQFIRLASDLPPGTISYQDTTPSVAGKNTYVIQAVSALPSRAQSDDEAVAAIVVTPQEGDGRPAVWLSSGPGFTTVGRLATEVEVTSARPLERVLRRYAGRPLPVEHSGEHVDETWQVSGNLNLRWSKSIDAPESPEKWLALGALEGPFLLRTPALFGTAPIYAYVSIEGPTVSRKKGGNVYAVSFTATRTGA